MDRTVTINGVELYFSATDVDFMKSINREEKKFLEAVATLDSENDTELLGMQFEAGCDLFDGIYGEGTSAKLFPKRDVGLVFDAYKLLIDEGKAQSERHIELAKEIFSGGDDEPLN